MMDDLAYREHVLTVLDDLAWNRFQQFGRHQDMDEVVIYRRAALVIHPPHHPDHRVSLNNLSTAIQLRFRYQGRIKDLEEGISLSRQLLAFCPFPGPGRAIALDNLGSALSTHFYQLGDIENITEAIACHREALKHFSTVHPNKPEFLDNIAQDFWHRFTALGVKEDLDVSIVYHRDALMNFPLGNPGRLICIGNLANALSTRFELSGKIEDIEDAITYHRETLHLSPPGHPEHGACVNDLACDLSTRFRTSGSLEDLEEAILHYREFCDLLPPGHRDRCVPLRNIADCLCIRFKRLGLGEDLIKAISCHREALDLCSTDHPERAACLNGLSTGLLACFNQFGRMVDLEHSIAYQREVLVLCSPDRPSRPNQLNDMGNSLLARFEQLLRTEDLDEATTHFREALVLHPPGHAGRHVSLHNLANAICTRFQRLSRVDLEQLEESINDSCSTLHLPSDHIDHYNSLVTKAKSILSPLKKSEKMDDLEEAIAYHCEALDLRPPGHPHRSASLHSLAVANSTRFDSLGQLEDLESAITHHRNALLCIPSHTFRFGHLLSLANVISTRYQLLGRAEDLEELHIHLSDAEAALPPDHPGHTMIRLHRALALIQYPKPFSEDDTSITFTLFENAVNHSTASSIDRLRAAWQWASIAHTLKHMSALRAYTQTFVLLGRCLIAIPTVESQHKFLAISKAVHPSFASNAAACAIEMKHLDIAVELLEQGRTLLWTQMHGYRHSLEELRVDNGPLAERFGQLSSQLEILATSEQSDWKLWSAEIDNEVPGTRIVYDAKLRRQRILSEQWEETLKEIRQIDGFQTFLRVVPFATLQTAAAEGPVIIVNISKYRSDAIILRSMDTPILVSLPNARPKTIRALFVQLQKALGPDCVNPSREILPVLRSLWYDIVLPVKNQLTSLGVAKMSRIWWCPTSKLCALPLHAAGPYLSGQTNLPDIYISSYTPTLSSLLRARSGAAARPTVMLIVGQPGDDIPRVTEELDRIQRLGLPNNLLVGEGVNPEAVLSALEQHSWVHFACHGHQHIEPFKSSFELHNGRRLTLLEIIRAQLPNVEFAFLSACYSAAGDILGSPDEIIHLAAGLQFSGFRGVVGTLWAMADVDGPDVAQDFYVHMLRKPGNVANYRDAATALNMSTREMRKRKGLTLDRWVNFIHIGA